MSLRLWTEREKWLKKAKASVRLAKYVSDESIQVATKLAHPAAEQYDAAPVHRSVVHKEKVKHANVSKLSAAAKLVLQKIRAKSNQ